MHRDSKYFIQSIHNLCDQSKKRMADFIDARVSLLNYSLLLDKQQFAQEFERDVNLSLNQPINDLVVELSDLLTQRARIQAKSVIEYIGNRPLASAVTKKSLPFLGALPFDSEFEKIRYELGRTLTHSLTYSRTHSLTYSLTRSLTHSLLSSHFPLISLSL